MSDKITVTKQKGFSLIELLIVVTIIGIVAAIAIPNVIAARRSANEGSAIASIRTLHGAQIAYQASSGAGSFAGTDSSTGDTNGLGILHGLGLIDDVLGSGNKSGYKFVGAVTASGSTTPATFFFSANPLVPTGAIKTGTKRYCVNQQGVIGADPNNTGTPFDAAGTITAPPFNPQ